MNKSQTVVVLGASSKIERYSNKAIRSLTENGYHVLPIGREVGTVVYGSKILASLEDIVTEKAINTVTIYLRARNQAEYIDQIISLKPMRVIFNPGAENPEFYSKLQTNGIEAINACTLVMLSIGTFQQ